MARSGSRRLISLLIAFLVFGAIAAPVPVSAKTWAQVWIRDGSLPLPPNCDTYQLVAPLERFFMEYNDGDATSLARRYPGPDRGFRVAIAMPSASGPTGMAMQTFTDWDHVATAAKLRQAMHDRFVLLQVEVVQNGNPWVDVTLDAFREADDMGPHIAGGTAAIDCRTGHLISLEIGDRERLAVITPTQIDIPTESPPASACRVAPLAAEELPKVRTGVTEAEWRWAITYPPAEVRAGRLLPNDYPAIPGMLATIEEFVACANAGDFARAAALFTPDYWRQPLAATTDPATRARISTLLAALTAGSGAQDAPTVRPTIDGFFDVRLLEDGRLSAGVGLAADASTLSELVIFEHSGDRWLIDAVHAGVFSG